MPMTGPDRDFWQQRFLNEQTPWDRGAPGPQLLAWLAEGRFGAAGARVLVPGCGQGHDLLPLATAGLAVTGLDFAAEAVARSRGRLQAAGLAASVLEADVLTWLPPQPVDAVYEQTCLCALHPDHWVAYAAQLRRWLRPGGQLLAMFMQAPREGGADGWIEGPPYHGDIHAMRALFPQPAWHWPKPPYAAVPHHRGWRELGVVLVRTDADAADAEPLS